MEQNLNANSNPKFAERRRALLRLSLAAAGVFLVTTALYFFVAKPMFRFVGDTARFRAWVNGHGVWSRLSFLGMMMFQIIVAFIPGEPLEIAAGFAFGVIEGTGLCILAALLAGTAVFLFVKRFGRSIVAFFFQPEQIDHLRFLKDERRVELTALLLFLIPGTPKDLLTYCAGLTKIRLPAWMLITSVARFPSVITSTLGGSALGMADYTFAAVVFGITLLLSLGGVLLYRYITRARGR